MTNLTEAIRAIVVQTMRAQKPTERVFGVVTSLKPFKVQVNEKLVLTETFLVLTQTIHNYLTWDFISVGSKVVMTRQPGGQTYIVDDLIESSKSIEDVILKHTHECPKDGGTSGEGKR